MTNVERVERKLNRHLMVEQEAVDRLEEVMESLQEAVYCRQAAQVTLTNLEYKQKQDSSGIDYSRLIELVSEEVDYCTGRIKRLKKEENFWRLAIEGHEAFVQNLKTTLKIEEMHAQARAVRKKHKVRV